MIAPKGFAKSIQIAGQRAAFTLIELLVVILVIGVLLMLLLPAIQAAREAARRSACENNLKQLSLAVNNHASAREEIPPGIDQRLYSTAPVYRGSSLFVYLLPYLEQDSLYKAWDFRDPQNSTQGGTGAISAKIISSLICPSDVIQVNPVTTGGQYYALTSYGGNAGTHGYLAQNSPVDGLFHTTGTASEPMPNQRPVRLKDITDGLSNTLLLGERYHRDLNYDSFANAGWKDRLGDWGWWAPGGGRKNIGHVTLSAFASINYRMPVNYDQRAAADPPADSPVAFQAYNELRLSAYGSGHPGGAVFALADGSVRFLGDRMSLDALQALSTRAGGETFNPD